MKQNGASVTVGHGRLRQWKFSAGAWSSGRQNRRCLRGGKRLGFLNGFRHGIGPELQGQLTSRASEVVVAFVSLDDALHQAVADDIALVEVNEADAFDAAQNLHRIVQSA